MADHHEFGTGKSYRVRASSDRTFGIVFGAIFGLLAIHNAWRAGANWPWCVAVATAILVVSWIRPSLLAPLNRLWTRLGLLLGRIVTPVVLGVIFFLGVTPIAALARILGRDFLRLKPNPAAASYRSVRRPSGPRPESMQDQF
jgi:hypothetical protein